MTHRLNSADETEAVPWNCESLAVLFSLISPQAQASTIELLTDPWNNIERLSIMGELGPIQNILASCPRIHTLVCRGPPFRVPPESVLTLAVAVSRLEHCYFQMSGLSRVESDVFRRSGTLVIFKDGVVSVSRK